jgi:recombinational DNA repair protein RecR
MQEKELQNHMEIKYAKDLELNDIENKFNEDMSHIQNENLKLNEQLKNAKMKINELNDNIINLKEINELTNKQLREKIENEQLILKENLKYKNAIEELNIQNEQNNKNIQKELNSYKQLTKSYNTIKSENIDLQKQIDASAQEKIELIDTNNKILEERKSFNEKYQIIINKLQNIKNIDITARTFDEFLQKISDEIILLNNEITNKQLREKIENEQIILKENLKYKNAIEEINIQNDENNRNLTKEINTYKNLTKTFNTIKSENLDLQRKINESKQENTKLIDKNNKILEEKKNFDEKYKIVLSKLSNVKNIEIQADTFDEFLQKISDEIIRIDKENEKLKEDIKTLNLKCFNMAQENENINQENKELKSILNKLKNEYDKELKEKDDIINQFDKCKMMNYQLQKTLDDYGTELNNKINDLNNLAYDKTEIENKNIKLNSDKQFLLTIILRINKLYSLSNIYELVTNLFNKGNITNNANDYNEKLVKELQRCQDYVNILKENDLQTHLLNLKLNQEIEEVDTQN